ncbi:IS200/IS605 family transposase [Aerosakkonema funiforme]|uniref:IS200/IS605 family transposase n=1 Tax=Aerosakkonema funiforme FACHB-1375 TaxID=2949571 RepID=A0A926ZGQ1_9CYAN|nr:IS200/IS605 family transposase [Aerosakkonema funiforme]MBD2182468.1 IS200/IS605 family transposase [Aerosakkonema funiforme FACHB-1375]
MSTTYHHGFRSVYRLNAHVVLVVKYRRAAINGEILMRLSQILKQTLNKWESELLEFDGESDHVHLLIDYKPDIPLSTLIGNLKTVSSRLIRKEYPWLAPKYFYNKPYFWTGSYFVASCGGATVEQLKKYVEQQATPE